MVSAPEREIFSVCPIAVVVASWLCGGGIPTCARSGERAAPTQPGRAIQIQSDPSLILKVALLGRRSFCIHLRFS